MVFNTLSACGVVIHFISILAVIENLKKVRNSMRKTLIFFVICLLIQSLSFTLPFSGEIYRWVDENGIVHFSDSFTNNSQSEK